MEQAESIAIGPKDDPADCRKEILAAIARVDGGEGAVVLTDMFGGTPSNLAISVMESAPVEVIAGANLPMLVKLAQVRSRMNLKDAARAAEDAGHKYIRMASRVLDDVS
jgi:PTS system mannose-specific IIA component